MESFADSYVYISSLRSRAFVPRQHHRSESSCHGGCSMMPSSIAMALGHRSWPRTSWIPFCPWAQKNNWGRGFFGSCELRRRNAQTERFDRILSAKMHQIVIKKLEQRGSVLEPPASLQRGSTELTAQKSLQFGFHWWRERNLTDFCLPNLLQIELTRGSCDEVCGQNETESAAQMLADSTQLFVEPEFNWI
jgi:hypothetical protein